MTIPTNWPNPEQPGVPLFPDRDWWHILQTYSSPGLFYWDSENGYWWDRNRRYYRTISEILVDAVETKYISICLTHTQIAEMLAAERERAAKAIDHLKNEERDLYGTGLMTTRAEITIRALASAADEIRNLGAAP